MRLAKPPSSVWVGERRGRVVFTRAGKVSAPGVPKAREHKTEDAAQAYLEAQRDERLRDGYVMVDETAGLDTPFTPDGKPRERSIPPKARHLAERVRTHVRGGFRSREEMGALIDDLAHEQASAARHESATRRHAGMTMDERTRDMDARAAAAREDPSEGDDKLRDLLAWVADTERAAVRATPRPTPCVNDAIDAAFAALDRAGIVALQAAGFTQSDGWEDANEEAARRRARGSPPRGACFYHEQDLERAVAGNGLMLSFGAYAVAGATAADVDAASLEVGRTIASTLREHGIDVEWNETIARRIEIKPFTWWRRG